MGDTDDVAGVGEGILEKGVRNNGAGIAAPSRVGIFNHLSFHCFTVNRYRTLYAFFSPQVFFNLPTVLVKPVEKSMENFFDINNLYKSIMC